MHSKELSSCKKQKIHQATIVSDSVIAKTKNYNEYEPQSKNNVVWNVSLNETVVVHVVNTTPYDMTLASSDFKDFYTVNSVYPQEKGTLVPPTQHGFTAGKFHQQQDAGDSSDDVGEPQPHHQGKHFSKGNVSRSLLDDRSI